MSVLVYIDSKDGIAKNAQEAVFYGSKIAAKTGGDTIVVTSGNLDNDALSALGKYGASKVIAHNSVDLDSQQLTKLVADVANDNGSKVVIFSQDLTGKAVAPRVAVRLNAGIVSGAIALPSDDFVVKVNAFSGKAFSFVKINSEVKVISVLPNSLQPEEGAGTAEVQNESCDLGASKVIVKSRVEPTGEIDLPEAELVVSAGRGLKGPENWGMVEDLAKALGAATACSRPVADSDWRPHHEHVGQTGVAIRPNLYIAAGISGAIQHLAGVNGSKVIVVINTDPEAPFFKAADYGIVGDAFEVLPKLTAAIKAANL
ncbi:MAG: electron transfer flavoprotein subunit alpha/FixB family protein [Flavobacteriales bacterium]|jgi:electron transfer flavoprotein alpha subunit|tara:strand:- start:3230 stop:4174 length:945 start_codon:yes stop_codon:yes gene_type:complete